MVRIYAPLRNGRSLFVPQEVLDGEAKRAGSRTEFQRANELLIRALLREELSQSRRVVALLDRIRVDRLPIAFADRFTKERGFESRWRLRGRASSRMC